MSSSIAPSVTLQFSLSDDPRTRLPEWYKDVYKASSTLLSHLDEAGGLFLVCTDATWHSFPGVLTNAAMLQLQLFSRQAIPRTIALDRIFPDRLPMLPTPLLLC